MYRTCEENYLVIQLFLRLDKALNTNFMKQNYYGLISAASYQILTDLQLSWELQSVWFISRAQPTDESNMHYTSWVIQQSHASSSFKHTDFRNRILL